MNKLFTLLGVDLVVEDELLSPTACLGDVSCGSTDQIR